MSEDRRPLPSREQIGAIDSVDLLEALLDDVTTVAERIEVDLEFGSTGDAAWESRALAALALHRGCARRLAARLDQVRQREAVVGSDQQREKTKRTAMSIVEGVGFGRAFMDAAKATLGPISYMLLVEGAQDLHAQRVADGVAKLGELAA